MREAARVANHSVVIKDHLLEGMFAGPTLHFMDWVGNRGHDVVPRTIICVARGGTKSSAALDFKSTLGVANSGSILIRLPGCSTGGYILLRG
jgi:hypothetical protein